MPIAGCDQLFESLQCMDSQTCKWITLEMPLDRLVHILVHHVPPLSLSPSNLFIRCRFFLTRHTQMI